ncbi:hypothetical protein BT67DRAFT_127170 [Trichocladium antarcticum]|uniref:Uncharacterized protein n=1 Tax=Trichocladium antarcticum TaxID=1450529 RepID=A0AAN6US59_9PEZI|nr:hypothetical protein BT67DRAFT_127170 [Trichocladium antarcticum]
MKSTLGCGSFGMTLAPAGPGTASRPWIRGMMWVSSGGCSLACLPVSQPLASQRAPISSADWMPARSVDGDQSLANRDSVCAQPDARRDLFGRKHRDVRALRFGMPVSLSSRSGLISAAVGNDRSRSPNRLGHRYFDTISGPYHDIAVAARGSHSLAALADSGAAVRGGWLDSSP